MSLRDLPRLRTARLELRLALDADLPEVLRHFSDNREYFKPFEPAKPADFYTEAFWKEQLRRSLHEFYADQSVRLFLFKREGSSESDVARRVIGTANLTQIFRGPFQAAYLGYGLSKEEQGKGLMSEALTAVIAYAFDELRLHRIMANYMPGNDRSARVLEWLGFTIEGRAKDYLLIDGAWRDHVLTSLIRRD